MIVTFPNFGNSWAAFRFFFESVGAEVRYIDKTNTAQMEKGLKVSPEWVCYPFKVHTANFIEALDKGITNLITATDCGPCRLGYYYAVQERILKDLGYNFSMKYIMQDDLLTFEWVNVLDSVCEDKRLMAPLNIFRTARIFLLKAQLIQKAERLEGLTRCYEADKGATTKIFDECLKMIDKADTVADLRHVKYKITNDFHGIKRKTPAHKIIKVGFTGEMQIVTDKFSNHDIKRKLGELGCEVHMHLSLYDWLKHKLHLNFHRKYLEYLSKSQAARGGLKMDIGGEAFWVLGEYIDWNKNQMDGFIHVYAFTCMPEITAKSIISAWHGNGYYSIPPLFISFDEHSAEAGMITRLEAYTDLLRAKKMKDDRRSSCTGRR